MYNWTELSAKNYIQQQAAVVVEEEIIICISSITLR
jgi:hypothetical protein